MPLILRPPGALDALPERLGELGRARRRVALTSGFFQLVAIGTAAFLAACLLDAACHLPGWIRAGFLTGILTTTGILALTGIRQSWRLSTHPLDVALLLEDRFPRFNDSLASAVSFLTSETDTGNQPNGAARFRAVAVTRAENIARKCDFDAIVTTVRAWRWFWCTGLLAGLTAVCVTASPTRAGLAVLRLADPYGNHVYPTRTTIELLEPTASPALLAKGNPFSLKFTLHGVIPEQAIITVRHQETILDEQLVPTVNTADPQGRSTLSYRLDPARADQSFEFRIVANDADTGWRAVTVAPAPKLIPRAGRPSPQFRLDYPAYTDLPPAELPDGAGVVEAVVGTRFTFRAAADRRIVSAAFYYEGDLTAVRAAAATAALMSDNPLSLASAMLLTDAFLQPIPVQISGETGTDLDVVFSPPLPGLYALRLVDAVGLTGVRLFNFETFPDPAPSVTLTRPNPLTDPLILLPSAHVPVQTRAEDRTFAGRTLTLEYRVGGPETEFCTVTLMDLDTSAKLLPALTGPIGVIPLKPVGLEVRQSIPVAAFVRPDGTAPTDGDSITLRAAATDWDTVAWAKSPGRSEEITIRILSRTSVEAMLQKQLAGMRPELLRQRESQREARRIVEEVVRSVKSGEWKPEDPGKLARAEQTQRQIRNTIADAGEGIRARAERLRQTVRANELPQSPTTERLERVADDLARLVEQNLNAADPLIAGARQEAEKGSRKPEDARKLGELLQESVKQQCAAETTLDTVLERLEQWAGAGEIRGEAHALQDELDQAGHAADQARLSSGSTEPTPAQKAARNAAADRFDQLADRAGGLVGKAARLAAEKDRKAADLRVDADDKNRQAAELDTEAAQQPAQSEAAAEKRSQAERLRATAENLRQAADHAATEAEALRRALDAAGGQALPRNLRNAADSLRKNQPDRAAAARSDAAGQLHQLTNGLTEQPGPSANELQQKRDAAADELQKLGEAQDELRKKVRQAAAIPDPQERTAVLEKLAREQERLRRKAGIVAEQLTRNRAEPAAEAVRRAAETMEAAREQLDTGTPSTGEQESSLDQLDQALDKLEQQRQETEDKLTREKQTQLTAELKSFCDRQQAAIAEANRLQQVANEAKRWDRPLIASLADLEDRERALAEELRQFVVARLAGVPVFSRLAGHAATAMDRAADLAAERRDDLLTADPESVFDVELETASAARVRRPMDTALRRLDQVLSAVTPEKPKKPEPDQPQAEKPPPDEPMPMPPAGAGEAEPKSPPKDTAQALAQLKVLRAVQAEVNTRTAAFAQSHPDPDKLTDDDRYELKELEQIQRDIAELFDQLADAFRNPPSDTAPEMP